MTLADGERVEVTPGFALVRAELDTWTPERAAEVTGVPAETIVRVAHGFAAERPAAVIMGGGSNHWFHGDLTGRAFALLAALTGNVGRSGGGFSVYVGQYKVRVDTSPWWALGDVKAKIVPSVYFVRGRTETMNETVPYPKNGFKALICTFANMFLQAMDVNRLHQTLDGCELVVVVDHQMTDTAKWADIVLPAATWYEKTDLTATPLHPYLQIQQAAIPPVGESRPELWMWQEIVRRIDPALFEQYFDMTAEEAIEAILAQGGATEGITLEQLQAGPVRLNVPEPRRGLRAAGRGARAVPAAVAAGAARGDRRLRPDAARRSSTRRRTAFWSSAKRSRRTSRRTTTRSTTPPSTRSRCCRRTPSGASTRATPTWPGSTRSPAAGRPCCSARPPRPSAASREGDLVELRNTRGSVRAWAHVTRGRPARHRHPLRGLVEPAARRRQERQRAHLLGGEPHPRDPLRGQHVGAVHRLEGLPLRGHEGRRRRRRETAAAADDLRGR